MLRALNGQVTERPPIWLMRQAGRYLPEYQAMRKEHSFLNLVRTPELAAEITLQPLRRFDFDESCAEAFYLLFVITGVAEEHFRL